MAERTTIRIEVDDSEEEISLPSGVLAFFSTEGQSDAETVADLLTVDCTERLYGFINQIEDDPSEEVRELEAEMRAQFEERFGASFEELLHEEEAA